MKHTKIAGFVFGLMIGLMLFKTDIWALEFEPIKKIPLFTLAPTAIPTVTPTITPGEPNSCNGTCGSNYNCKGDLFCYQAYCRNPECPSDSDCQCATSLTVAPTKNTTITSTPNSTAEITPSEPTADLTKPPETTPTSTTTPANTQNNMTMWFLIVTVGLLAAIIVIQAWPRKDGREDSGN